MHKDCLHNTKPHDDLYGSKTIKKFSFHIANDNHYLCYGITRYLNELEQNNSNISYDYTTFQESARSTLLLSEMIRCELTKAINIVIATEETLHHLELSLKASELKKIIFINIEQCALNTLRSIFTSPNDILLREKNSHSSHALVELSNREKHICYYLSRGYSRKRISSLLGVSVQTISRNSIEIINKMGCSNRIGLYNTIISLYGVSSRSSD